VIPAHWSFLSSPPADGATNMAVDAALLDLVARQGAVWRCYTWDQPTVSFGRNERTAGRFSAERLRQSGLPAVRRPTGGRALLHAREVTYSVTLPLDERLPWRAAYDAVNTILLQAIRGLGVPAQLVDRREARPVTPDGPLCFDEPAAGEIVVAGRKLVGSAVWRQGGHYLQHGSILLADDQGLLATASAPAFPAPPPAASLGEYLAGSAAAPWSLVTHAIAAALSEAVGDTPDGTVAPFVPCADFAAQVAGHRAFFASDEWLWRR
jgi:lipoate-protein ligase A